MQSVADYFGLESPNDLAWRHGVVTREAMMATAADTSLHVAVATVRYGPTDALPMLAEKGQDHSDLDIMTWLATLQAANKAVKLDFTDPASVEPTLQVMHRLSMSVPVMVHGNVFSLLPHNLPDGGRSEGMEPEQFFRLVQRYAPKAVISIGWSLKRTHDADGRLEEALIEQIADMSLHRLGGANYSIEIRAGFTPGHERGAALIFDPLDGLDTPLTRFSEDGNVVDATARFRRAA